MKENSFTTVQAGFAWFAAAASPAGLLSGASMFPLGIMAVPAVLLGCAAGCTLLYLTGLIGVRTSNDTVQSARRSFGQSGALFFAAINIIHLMGQTTWQLHQICGFARWDPDSLSGLLPGKILCLGGGILLLVFLYFNIMRKKRFFLSCILLSSILLIICNIAAWKNPQRVSSLCYQLSFAEAAERSAAIVLSFLPVIADYMQRVDPSEQTRAVRVIPAAFFAGGSFVQLTGLIIALRTGSSDLFTFFSEANLEIPAAGFFLLSASLSSLPCVYSAAQSASAVCASAAKSDSAVCTSAAKSDSAVYASAAKSDSAVFTSASQNASAVCASAVCSERNTKKFILAASALSAIIALSADCSDAGTLFYLLSSVFVPMVLIEICDFFLLKRDCSQEQMDRTNTGLWISGFLIYRILYRRSLPAGYTIPAALLLIAACFACSRATGYIKKYYNNGKDV